MRGLIVSLVLLALPGCAYVIEKTQTIDESKTVRISPEYVAAGDAEGLRAFAYGDHTIISSDESFNAWDSNKVKLTFEKIGQYFRSEYLLNDFFVQRGFKLAHIKRVFMPEQVKLVEVAPVKTEPVKLIKSYPKIEEYSQSQLDTVQRELDRQADRISTTGADLFYAQVNLNKHKDSLKDHKPVLLFYFDFAKTLFKPNDEFKALLIPELRTASEIHLRGRTDSIRASKADVWIAEQRATNVKDFLVKNGVKPSIIKVSHLSEGNFLLPPKPSVSKAVNRRVELIIKP